MNYLGEIKLFYEWMYLRNGIRPSTIVLWHGLMYLAHLEDWKQPMAVPESKLILVTNLPHTTLYRERRCLCKMGLLRVVTRGGKIPSLYTLISMEAVILSYHGGTTTDTEEVLSYHGGTTNEKDAVLSYHTGTTKGANEGLSYHGGTTNGTTKDVLSSHIGTTNPIADTQEADSGEDASRTRVRDFSVKKNKSIHDDMKEKETNKKKKRIEWREWLETGSQEPWKSILRLWLEYKEERGEHYSGAVSLGRLQSHLKNISGDNPAVAQQVVDRSIACNWKGLFPLDRAFTAPSSSTPQQGQHIGQIMQPRSEQARSSVLDKFNSKANKTDK